jgi:four helix bundle protein
MYNRDIVFRNSDAEFARFCQISMGSATELEYHLLLAFDLNFLEEKDYNYFISELIQIKKMLFSFMDRLRNNPSNN